MLPRRRGDGAAHPPHRPLERGGDGPAGEQPQPGHRRPPRRRTPPPPPCTRSASTTSSAARTTSGTGDQIFYQGHAAPGMYARAFLEGRLTEDQLDHFRREVGARRGPLLVSAPAADARLLGVPDGLDGPRPAQRDLPGALQPLPRQPRPRRHVAARASGPSSATARSTSRRRSAALSLAAREGLDNLTFVVNCNLQRLDGPVRGNGKIIQELEGLFRGAGWNVIKVIWGREWDELLARDVDGVLVDQMNETRRRRVPEVLGRGRRLHPRALLRARSAPAPSWSSTSPTTTSPSCAAAATTTARSTPRTRPRPSTAARRRSILAKPSRAGRSAPASRRATSPTRPRSSPRPSSASSATGSSCRSPTSSSRTPRTTTRAALRRGRVPAERRRALGGLAAAAGRPVQAAQRGAPRRSTPSSPRAAATAGLARRWSSPGCCATCCAIPSSARGSCRSSPTRRAPSAWTRSSTRSGSTPPWDSATSRSTPSWCCPTARRRTARSSRRASPRRARWPASRPPARPTPRTAWPMIPFYIFYSMFGFQRTGDQIWAFGDARGRGFMLGATAGRTTLNGEGLQHDDGHSPLLASTDPERARLRPGVRLRARGRSIRDGIERMYVDGEDVFYYITLYNENYPMPPMPDGVDEGILRGLYRFAGRPSRPARSPRRTGSGSSAAARSCSRSSRRRRCSPSKFGVAAEVYSAPSFQLLRRRRPRGRALEPAPPGREAPGCRTSARCSAPTAGPS